MPSSFIPFQLAVQGVRHSDQEKRKERERLFISSKSSMWLQVPVTQWSIALLVFQSFGVLEEGSAVNVSNDRRDEILYKNSIWRPKKVPREQHWSQVSRIVSRQWSGASRVGCRINSDSQGAHKERTWRIFLCPISRTECNLSAILFVDGIDGIHLDTNKQ
jgi:hypothetical protein